MNRNAKFVFNGFLELSSEEKMEFVEALSSFLEEVRESKRGLKEFSEHQRVTLGPLPPSSGICPCCGNPK